MAAAPLVLSIAAALPFDVLCLIASFVPTKTRIRVLSRVCQRWRLAVISTVRSLKHLKWTVMPAELWVSIMERYPNLTEMAGLLPWLKLATMQPQPVAMLERLTRVSFPDVFAEPPLRRCVMQLFSRCTSLKRLDCQRPKWQLDLYQQDCTIPWESFSRLETLNFEALGDIGRPVHFPALTSLKIGYSESLRYYRSVASQLRSLSIAQAPCTIMPEWHLTFPSLTSLDVNNLSVSVDFYRLTFPALRTLRFGNFLPPASLAILAVHAHESSLGSNSLLRNEWIVRTATRLHSLDVADLNSPCLHFVSAELGSRLTKLTASIMSTNIQAFTCVRSLSLRTRTDTLSACAVLQRLNLPHLRRLEISQSLRAPLTGILSFLQDTTRCRQLASLRLNLSLPSGRHDEETNWVLYLVRILEAAHQHGLTKVRIEAKLDSTRVILRACSKYPWLEVYV